MTDLIKSSNLVPFHSDWSRYQSPTVIRRHGLEFLEHLWNTEKTKPVAVLGVPKLATIDDMVKQNGGTAFNSEGVTLLKFASLKEAAACAEQLQSLPEAIRVNIQLCVEYVP